MKNPKIPSSRARLTITTLSLAALCLSCATHQPLSLNAVGPKNNALSAKNGKGYLQVFTDTDDLFHLEKEVTYHNHSGYSIQRSAGQPVQWVPNHTGDMDETAQLITLPAGKYQVLARSTDYGQVRIPVVIAPAQITKIHLEGRGTWKPKDPSANSTNLVRFPDGELIGWQAPLTPQ